VTVLWAGQSTVWIPVGTRNYHFTKISRPF